mmetsp:Transcript_3548/g.7108  ORF Transcript_3548/g.7108 Transcript_3548/m.7108 type:complete len:353 (+) Transcript_3548:117-1175(+)
MKECIRVSVLHTPLHGESLKLLGKCPKQTLKSAPGHILVLFGCQQRVFPPPPHHAQGLRRLEIATLLLYKRKIAPIQQPLAPKRIHELPHAGPQVLVGVRVCRDAEEGTQFDVHVRVLSEANNLLPDVLAGLAVLPEEAKVVDDSLGGGLRLHECCNGFDVQVKTLETHEPNHHAELSSPFVRSPSHLIIHPPPLRPQPGVESHPHVPRTMQSLQLGYCVCRTTAGVEQAHPLEARGVLGEAPRDVRVIELVVDGLHDQSPLHPRLVHLTQELLNRSLLPELCGGLVAGGVGEGGGAVTPHVQMGIENRCRGCHGESSSQGAEGSGRGSAEEQGGRVGVERCRRLKQRAGRE